MKFVSVTILLAAFAGAISAMPNSQSDEMRKEQDKLIQLDAAAKDMPTDPNGHFEQQGDHVLSIDSEGKVLADKVVHLNKARKVTPNWHMFDPRWVLCLQYPCDENWDCEGTQAVTPEGRRYACTECEGRRCR